MKLLKVVIDRAKWDVKENHEALGMDTSYHIAGKLVRTDRPGKGLQCCLGFVGRVCRIQGMFGASTPADVPSKKWPKGLVNEDIANKLMKTNDSKELGPSQREANITKLGREAGIAFRFVGKYLKEKKS